MGSKFADAPTLLAALITAVRYRAPPILSVKVKNPAIDAAELHGKYIVLDLLAEDSDGAQYNVEMQIRRHRAWSARSTYYLARLIGGQLVAGQDYGKLKPAMGIRALARGYRYEPDRRRTRACRVRQA
jgi:predicted transposase/invertase (TIGR01784 family)